jgi:hypothetical protein
LRDEGLTRIAAPDKQLLDFASSEAGRDALDGTARSGPQVGRLVRASIATGGQVKIGEPKMVNPMALREQAERCFRLADSITDPEMVSRLQYIGQSYEDAALRAESESQSRQNADADVAPPIDDGLRP